LARERGIKRNSAGCVHVNAVDNIGLVKSRKTRSEGTAPDRSLPGQDFQPNITLLEERLLKEGADPDTVNVLRTTIFHKGVTKEALKAKFDASATSLSCQQGIHRGAMVYNLLLRVIARARWKG